MSANCVAAPMHGIDKDCRWSRLSQSLPLLPDTMRPCSLVAALIGFVSLLHATAGQAGAGFLAIMACASFPIDEMRPTALLLNIIAAVCATRRLHRANAIVRRLLMP